MIFLLDHSKARCLFFSQLIGPNSILKAIIKLANAQFGAKQHVPEI